MTHTSSSVWRIAITNADIIDALAEIFTYEELKDFGAGDFVRDYFEDGDE